LGQVKEFHRRVTLTGHFVRREGLCDEITERVVDALNDLSNASTAPRLHYYNVYDNVLIIHKEKHG